MNRRDALRLTGNALLLTAVPWPLRHAIAGRESSTDRLFFDPADLSRIRANTQTPLLGPVYEAWRERPLAEVREIILRPEASGDLLGDLGQAMIRLQEQSIVYLGDPTPARRDLLLDAISMMNRLPKWDYFFEAGDQVIGIMRASIANTSLLLAREALGEALPADLEAELLANVAEKGCLPCYRTIYGMDHPDEVVGWSFDPEHNTRYEISLARWPEILGANNLRAIPTMGLGLGALAVLGHDERAGLWLETAVESARTYLRFFSPDGSYFEGLSYVDYAFRSMLPFLEAHYRTQGTVDWIDEANFYGVTEFIVCMQTGRTLEDDGLEIVNFSDARVTTRPMVASWIARRGGDRLAQYAAEHFSTPGYFGDFLWYEAMRPETPPPASLKNKRFDLDWIVCRTGWAPDDSVLAFRSGLPANHEHADRNSFLFKAYGERLLTDHFGAAYDWRQPGWLLRQTEAHNAVLIDGRGHQYHDGEEGTNEGLAEAYIVRYVDRGDVVWWCSDVTQGYSLVDPDVQKVVRSVLFAKPDVVILFDQIEKATTPSTLSARFHPENRDGRAALHVGSDGHFRLERPGATLFGRAYAAAPPVLSQRALDLPAEMGSYPYVDATTPAALRHDLITVLVARPAGGAQAPPAVQITPRAGGWDLTIAGTPAAIDRGGPLPELRWG